MNTKYLYTARGFVLPQNLAQEDWSAHLSSLPAIPVQGTHGFEVGKFYELDKDFKLESIYVEPSPEIHCNRGSDKWFAIPLPPQPTQDKAGIDTGEQLYRWVKASERVPSAKWNVTYLCRNINNHEDAKVTYWNGIPSHFEWLEPIPTPAERTFTLDDMQDAFESGVCLGWFHEGPEIKQGPPPLDMKQYFNSRSIVFFAGDGSEWEPISLISLQKISHSSNVS